jgi:hypothetical protein
VQAYLPRTLCAHHRCTAELKERRTRQGIVSRARGRSRRRIG